MAQVTCSRCGTNAPGLERAPLPGPFGRQVLDHVCQACWREWLGMQVKFINEYRLSSQDPRHFDFLMSQAREFLKLEGGESS